MDHLRVLAPTRYPWKFNGPRRSRHLIENRNFLPLNRLSDRVEAVTVFNPFPVRRFDLVHAFNRIPLTRTPFVIGFESHLPRAFGLERSRYFEALTRLLISPRCRAIIAISDHARRTFLAVHSERPWATALSEKLQVRYPNIELPDGPADVDMTGEIHVVFVGHHFGRKGGCVAVRMAELAHARNIPLRVHVVSNLEVGGSVWTDPHDKQFFERYFALLRLPNVEFHGTLSNKAVMDLLRTAHFSILATFGDTFGYSALESMARGTPLIATSQCALPEFIKHRVNGIMLSLPTNDRREWVHLGSRDRTSNAFKQAFAEEVERLAHEALSELSRVAHSRDEYARMRSSARRTVEEMFSTLPASRYWDELYANSVR